MRKIASVAIFLFLALSASSQVQYASEGGKIKAVWVENRERFTDSMLTVQLLAVPYTITQKIEIMNELTKVQVKPGENRFDLYLNTTNRKLWKTSSK